MVPSMIPPPKDHPVSLTQIMLSTKPMTGNPSRMARNRYPRVGVLALGGLTALHAPPDQPASEPGRSTTAASQATES